MMKIPNRPLHLILPLILVLTITTAAPQVRAEGVEEFLEKYLSEVPDESINPLFRQSMAVQRRSLSRAGQIILGFQPNIDLSFGPYGNFGFGLKFGYALSERLEATLLWVPYVYGLKKSIAGQLDELEFTNGGDAPDLEQSKKRAEYTAVLHWVPGYGKIAFSKDRSYRYDMFFDLILGYVQYDSSTSPKLGVGFGNAMFFSDNFSIRYSVWGSVVNSPDLESNSSSPTLVGEFQLGFLFYL